MSFCASSCRVLVVLVNLRVCAFVLIIKQLTCFSVDAVPYSECLKYGVLSGQLSSQSIPVKSTPALGADVEMVQEGEAAAGAELIMPRRLPNPCLESPQRMDLHRELMFNQKIGKNVLNQKSELQKALAKHREKQVLHQKEEVKETPELERIIAERARRLEQAEQSSIPEPDTATNATLQEIRARLRHASARTVH